MDGKPLALSKFSRLMEILKADVGGNFGDYIDQGRRWKKLHKDDYSHEDIVLLKELEELIKEERLPLLPQEDTMAWDLTRSGNFIFK